MSLNTPKEYSVLVIEDHAEMRSSVRSMITRYGCEKIDIVLNGEEALAQLQNNDYDLILSDYELGRGLDGQQVLEETRRQQLTRYSAVYIMITAAQTMDMVMGAIEYHPDGYLAKPITYDMLNMRINKIVKFKAHFADIHAAMDNQDVDQALIECDRLIVAKPKLVMPALRIKSKLLFDNQKVDSAKDVYSQVLSNRELPWAVLGFCKCLYEQKNYEPAIPMLKNLIASNPCYIECYDLLAKILVQVGDHVSAQQTLEDAINYSPKIASRQSQLCDVATENKDWEVVARSARKTLSLSKLTSFTNPKTYVNLVESLQVSMATGSMRDKNQGTIEAARCIENIREMFTEPDILTKTDILETMIEVSLGNKEKAHQLLQDHHDKFIEMESSLKKQFKEDLYEVYREVTDELTAKDLLKDIMTHSADNPSKRSFQSVFEDNVNNTGVQLYKEGKLREALELFEKASKRENAGDTVLVNTLQTLVKLYSDSEDKAETIASKCEFYIEKLQSLNSDNTNYGRYKALCDNYQQLQDAGEEENDSKLKSLFKR